MISEISCKFFLPFGRSAFFQPSQRLSDSAQYFSGSQLGIHVRFALGKKSHQSLSSCMFQDSLRLTFAIAGTNKAHSLLLLLKLQNKIESNHIYILQPSDVSELLFLGRLHLLR